MSQIICMHRRCSCGVFFCFSVLCHNRGYEVGSAAVAQRSVAWPPLPCPGAFFGRSLFRAVYLPQRRNTLEQITGFVRGVYFALKRRGLKMRQALRKKLSLVLPHKGKNKGKFFMVADLRKMQDNQWVSEIRIDKSGFISVIGAP